MIIGGLVIGLVSAILRGVFDLVFYTLATVFTFGKYPEMMD